LADEEYVVRHLETKADIAGHLELMRNVFGQNSRVDLMVKKWIDHYPAIDLEDFFVIKHRGKIVAALNIIPSTWSVGGVPLKVAELACVATLPEYRRVGLQRRLMKEYHKQIEEEGYDLSAIEGIPYYYRQFGYEYALPLLEETRITLEKVPDYKSTHVIRPLSETDIPKAKQLLADSQRKFNVHAIREEAVWKMQQETGMIADAKFEGYAVEDKGKMAAYLRISENQEAKELLLREISDADQLTAKSILTFLKNIGKQRGLETLVVAVSYHESFVKHLLATGEAKQSNPYAWQMRVTDHSKLFGRLKPLFEKRIADSTFRRLTEKVSFNFYCFAVQIAFENGTITSIQRLETVEDRTIRFNPLVSVQLLLGYRSREELEAIYPDFLVRPSHKYLVDVLFPKLPSYIHTNY
jgi:predicted acetyltransferase